LIVYEYPFNERIRTLLRLEDLFEKFTFFLHQESPLQHHVALATIFEILEVAGRADLKSDLLQELERQKQTLLAYQTNPNVEPEMLNAILAEVDRASVALSAAQGRTGQNIRDNEWLMSIRGFTILLRVAATLCTTTLSRHFQLVRTTDAFIGRHRHRAAFAA
jgi:cell division protein ZapD